MAVRYCPVCGKVVQGREVYCSVAHKQKAYRQRGLKRERSLSLVVERKLAELIGDRKSREAIRYFDRISTAKSRSDLNRGLAVILTTLEIMQRTGVE